jgi:hypothetical protein
MSCREWPRSSRVREGRWRLSSSGVSLASVAGFLLAGFDSSLSFLLPCAFLGWLVAVVAALQE